ncbi:hemoglobin subunit beta-2 [Bombina bombina]|uniref:hemoglobin subunit beta-2 n=1 Tax=Bombina bombina TaxID=8345 RepID=UPI00235A938F|nr:hemoglobin subunit beta-2 [Bombina bombina]
MVHWTSEEKQHIAESWAKVNCQVIGAEALGRLLIVYPWTQRYFPSFGNLGTADAIMHNAKVAAHGAKVLGSIGEAVKHMDDIKGHYAQLSKYHSEKLHVDPANFERFGEVVSIVMSGHFGAEYTAEVQSANEKLFGVVADALGKAYH